MLLLVDLCGRLPYNVKGLVNGIKCIIYPHDVEDLQAGSWPVNPYLRPLSSMTEKEESEYQNIVQNDGNWVNLLLQNLMDFFNRYHFDCRGLIEMGLAIEAPKGMYN